MRKISESLLFNNILLEKFKIYKFDYLDGTNNKDTAKILNPVIWFSHLDQHKNFQGLNLRGIRNKDIFLEDFKSFQYDKLEPAIIRHHFKRNPDAAGLWRVYYAEKIKNVQEVVDLNLKTVLAANILELNNDNGLF